MSWQDHVPAPARHSEQVSGAILHQSSLLFQHGQDYVTINLQGGQQLPAYTGLLEDCIATDGSL